MLPPEFAELATRTLGANEFRSIFSRAINSDGTHAAGFTVRDGHAQPGQDQLVPESRRCRYSAIRLGLFPFSKTNVFFSPAAAS